MLVLTLVLVQSVTLAAEVNVAPNAFQAAAGTWVPSATTITNTDTSSNNTNAYAPIEQKGTEITFEWTITFKETLFSSGPAAGMHILCSEGPSTTRGTSYLVFQDKSFVRIYKTSGGKLLKNGDFPTTDLTPGETHTYKAVYSTQSGVLTVYRDGQSVGTFTDAAPIQNGEFVSLRTNGSVAEFKAIKVTSK